MDHRNIFGKQLHEITLADLQEFFSIEREESSTLEFKSGEVQLESLYKGICAMLNTEGGLIIVGTPRERDVTNDKGKKRRVCIGELVPSNITKTVESLNQLISTNVTPITFGIKIHPIPVSDNTSIYLIDVAQSQSPPHQAQGAYFIRVDRRNTPAPHGLVEALFNRRRQPSFKVSASIDTSSNWLFPVKVTVKNEATYPADGFHLIVEFYGLDNASRYTPGESITSHQLDFFKTDNGVKCWNDPRSETKVLASHITATIEYLCETKLEKFIMKVTVWNKDVDSNVWCCLMNARDGSIKPLGKDYFENSNLAYIVNASNFIL